MRIGLNATCFNNRPSGATQRFKGIYGALIEQCPDIEFVIYEPSDCQVASWFKGAANIIARSTPIPSSGRLSRWLKGRSYWRRAFIRDKLDLFEQFHLPPVRAPCPTLMTIHDARSKNHVLLSNVMGHSMKEVDCVITVSEAMRQELLSIAPTCRIETIYNGVEPSSFDKPSDIEAVRRRFNLPINFLLAVGHLEPRKNYPRLIEAMAHLRNWNCDVSLVIVGNDSGEGTTIAARIYQFGLEGRVQLLQDISDEELAAVYALSSLVVFPSYYEGFGIPVLEAMSAHRSLVCSDIPVFRELTEGYAAYFPVHDSAQMATAIQTLLDDPVRRQECVAHGIGALDRFAFPKLAAQIETIYRSLIPGAAV